jgi:pimeloyl-ACP methyl ester carboxylesterase
MNSVTSFLLLALAFGQVTTDPPDTSPHTEAFVQANGVRLHYLDWGGKGDPLLFLTGYGAPAHVFDSLAHHFTRQFRVLAVTRRGRPPSERPATGYELGTLVADLHGFLRALGLERVHLVGHSFGGTEMTELAARHPERVISLVYLDAALDLAAAEAVMKEASAQRPQPPPGSPFAQVTAWMNAYTPDFSRLKSPALAFYALQDRNPNVPDSADAAVRQKADELWRANWIPMIRQTASKFQREAPQGRVVFLENASHYLFRDREQDVVREMRAFYASMKPNR